MSRRSFLTAVAAYGLLAACGSDPDEARPEQGSPDERPSTGRNGSGAGEATPVAHDYSRIEPDPDQPLDGIVGADANLAGELFRLMSDSTDGNFIFSPYSIATAFSMAEAGARQDTEQQMRDVLGITTDDETWHSSRNALDRAVRTPTTIPDGATPLELEIANVPFGQSAFAFADDFIRVLAEHYGAELVTVDFAVDPEGARALINDWIAEQTGDRITDLLPDGSVDSLMRLMLVNTVFFKAQWTAQFDPEQTALAPFSKLDGSSVEVDMMHGSSRTTYGEGDGWQAVRLPYWGGYSMLLILPAVGRFDDVVGRLPTSLFDEIGRLQGDFQVDVALPRFNFATRSDLVPLFESLGMNLPFTAGSADFSGITDETDLFISSAYHQATIEVDELGTTATAATALGMRTTSAPPPAELRADRPFVFAIEHDASGEPLFVGRVLDPTS